MAGAMKKQETLVKRMIDADAVQRHSLKIAKQIYNSLKSVTEHTPTTAAASSSSPSSGDATVWLVALWRGGATFGLHIQGYLQYMKVKTNHIAIKTSSYTTPGQEGKHKEVVIHDEELHYFVRNCKAEDTLIIVDDVLESGDTIRVLLDKLSGVAKRNMPIDVRIAVGFWKPPPVVLNITTTIKPDYFAEQTSDWLVFSHEYADLDDDEIEQLMGHDIAQLVINHD